MVAECRKRGVVMGTNHHLRNAATHRAMRAAIARAGSATAFRARVPLRLSARPSAGLAITAPTAAASSWTSRFMTPTRFDSSSARSRIGVAMTSNGGMGREGLEDGAMGVMRFRTACSRNFIDAFTTRYATTGFEVHGEAGSLFGLDCMTQAPKGEVILRNRAGESSCPRSRGPVRALGPPFQAAVQGRGAAFGDRRGRRASSIERSRSPPLRGAHGRGDSVDLTVSGQAMAMPQVILSAAKPPVSFRTAPS